MDAKISQLDYRTQQDTDEVTLMPGIEFWGSRRAKVRLSGGYGWKSHPETGDSDSSLLWNVDASWRPQRKTTFAFDSAREFLEVFVRDEDLIVGEFGTQTHGRLRWMQRWTPHVQSEFAFTWQDRDFEQSSRDESAMQWQLGGQYQVSPRLTVRGTGVYTTQQGDNSRDYDRWTFTVHADYQL